MSLQLVIVSMSTITGVVVFSSAYLVLSGLSTDQTQERRYSNTLMEYRKQVLLEHYNLRQKDFGHVY